MQEDSHGDTYRSRYVQVFLAKYLYIVAHSGISHDQCCPPMLVSASMCSYVCKKHAHTYPLGSRYCSLIANLAARYMQIPAHSDRQIKIGIEYLQSLSNTYFDLCGHAVSTICRHFFVNIPTNNSLPIVSICAQKYLHIKNTFT
jgi:hypothetical protein